ncbi:lipid A biosynthesis lauroyl acyltransferase [Fulvimarina sp. 2208YS6-2-32]|uniref:Lipid A biosynthesis lauroyl acyltransferase n=1 Tax=Fulvimarina uroteuthidis TaxID=3098149 RepID=A0ABU5I4B6_9HYPH|nr:lipid A biosynthesis lauroyl acyltransferase [Fulvimarina sp. 2208YS6-2-32]MDY8109930.1 lipid A biosynthesis lauroyl acyltransferase [Fulvimarina sp. 2208YS6-2-32]
MNPRLLKLVLRTKRVTDWVTAKALFAVLSILRFLPPEKGLELADRFTRTLGPLTPRHKLALHNLRRAFPEKDEAWIEKTARANWGHMGRLAAEFVFLDDLFDFDVDNPDAGRVEVKGQEIFEDFSERKGPFIFFTGHTGSFELLPIGAAAYGFEFTALFRQPNNRYVAERVQAARRTAGGHLVPSKAGAAWTLAGILDKGGSVGMLTDQKFKKGQKTTFFGLPCKTSPLLPKLARQYDAEVYPARSIRLENGRYRLELFPPITLPRREDGEIDLNASCQALNDIVEGWVREYPEQWMWFHDRWNQKKLLR